RRDPARTPADSPGLEDETLGISADPEPRAHWRESLTHAQSRFRSPRLSRHLVPAADGVSDEGGAAGGGAALAGALGADGPLRPHARGGERAAAVHPARRPALRERRNP